MKKVIYLSFILILLAVLPVPVMAKGPNNGNDHGNGVSGEQGNQQNQGKHVNNGLGGNGNHGQTRMRTPFYLQGTISGVDTGAKTLTVTLVHGNAQVKQYIGTNLALQANDTTLIFKITQGNNNGSETGQTATPTLTSDESNSNRLPITFDQLAVGQKVAIHGNLLDGVYTVRLITVYLQAPIGESIGG
jgi:hypothetical protein